MNTAGSELWRGRQEWVPLAGAEEGAAADRRLLEAARAGDDAALEALLARHQQGLYALCRGILGRAEDAEDAVQETFLRALRALRGFRSDASFRTWLTRIAVNVCLEWKRAAAARPAREPAPAAREHAESDALVRLYVLEALSVLPPRQRAVLLLKEMEGWSVAEIAAGLGCTGWRVYYELRLAHQALAAWRRRSEEGE